MNHPARPEIFGVDLDPQSRCAHWHSDLDVVAMRFKCCRQFFACRTCHDTLATHPPELWDPTTDHSEIIALCGICHAEFTLSTYLPTHDTCPNCKAAWNPGCVNHRHLYLASTMVHPSRKGPYTPDR